MNGQDYLDAAGRLELTEGLDPWTALMRVLVARLKGLDLPPLLRRVLVHAESHWSGRSGDLRSRKVEVWQYVESLQRSGADLAMPEGRAARALLCVLESAGDAEALSMTAEWFAAMVDDQQTAG